MSGKHKVIIVSVCMLQRAYWIFFMLFDCFPQYGFPYCHTKVFSYIPEMGLPSNSSELVKEKRKKKKAVLFFMSTWGCFSLTGSSCLHGDDIAGFAL